MALKETDLDVGVGAEAYSAELVVAAAETVRRCRRELEEYIAGDPAFAATLTPHAVPPKSPAIVRAMAAAAARAGVGPMAAVAGAVAQWVGTELGRSSREVAVENGGDIYLLSERARPVAIFAGTSPFSGHLALEIPPEQAAAGLGVCTSSGTVGHSLSFGRADAAVIVAGCAPLADAVATATGNRIGTADDLEASVEYACSVPGVIGAVAVAGERLAAKGNITLRRL